MSCMPRDYIFIQALIVVEAQYDCDPDHPDELGFKEGEKIVVTKKMSKDWWVSDTPTTHYLIHS